MLNNSEYQLKIQRLAFYAEQADHEAMQGVLDSKESILSKNEFLQPIFRDIKATIKHMTHTEEYKLLREYSRNRHLVLSALPEESKKAQDGLRDLKNCYSKLI